MTEFEEQLYNKGVDAKAVLENETITNAFNEIADALKDAIVNTSPVDAEKRRAYYYTYKGLFEVRNLLSSYVAAKEQLDAVTEDEQEELFEDSNF